MQEAIYTKRESGTETLDKHTRNYNENLSKCLALL